MFGFKEDRTNLLLGSDVFDDFKLKPTVVKHPPTSAGDVKSGCDP